MIVKPLPAGSTVPQRHRETAASIARWFGAATANAREIFVARVAACWAAAGPEDLRLLYCLKLCLAADRSFADGSTRRPIISEALTLDIEPLQQLLTASLDLTNMPTAAEHAGPAGGREELHWALQILLELLSNATKGNNLKADLFSEQGEHKLVKQVITLAETVLPLAPAEAARMLLLLARAGMPDKWSCNPSLREQLLEASMRMLQAAGVSIHADISKLLHESLKVALDAYDPRRGIGSWACDDFDSSCKEKQMKRSISSSNVRSMRPATAPSKRWAKGVRSPQKSRLPKLEHFLTEL
jgi:hypothetical protein